MFSSSMGYMVCSSPSRRRQRDGHAVSAIHLQSAGGYVADGAVRHLPSSSLPSKGVWALAPWGHCMGRGPKYLPSGSNLCNPGNLIFATGREVKKRVGLEESASYSHWKIAKV